MAKDEVRRDLVGHVLTITLNRPERMNAATFDMADQLRDALEFARDEVAVRAVVLTGAGEAFCSGDDVEAAWGDPRMVETQRTLEGVRPPITPEVALLRDFPKPIVAAVHGPALGIGMDFALWADIRIASTDAVFGQLFVRMGLSADVTGYWLLPQLVGPQLAAELLFTGRKMRADEALQAGLVTQVVPPEQLQEVARSLAERIAANSPRAVQSIKQGLRLAQGREVNQLDDLGAWVGTTLARMFTSKDHREAVAAFMEKREPNFSGD